MTQRKLRINVNVQSSGAHPASWRSPQGRPLATVDIAHFQEVARIAERGKLDAVFLADALAIHPDPSTAPMWTIDPIVLTTAMALATENIGFIVSNSTTFSQPYNLARAFLSLDHISGGRVGWNIVTTYDERAATNFGLAQLPPHEERYAAAAEFVDLVLKLWDSWEADALVADLASGVFADHARIHKTGHVGKYAAATGPLQVPRSPQGRPLLVQAGSSPQGRDLAAQFAEGVFTIQQVLGEAQAYYADIKRRASAYGRDPATVAVLPGISLVIGGTEAEARARKRELDEIAGIDKQLPRYAARLGVAPSELDLDKPVPTHLLERIRSAPGSRGWADANFALASEGLTVREIIAQGGGAHRLVVGSPEQIADHIQSWFEAGAADGFNIMSDVYPDGLAAFSDHVVPVLQKRGLFRTEYEGRTLREHYGVPAPENIHTARARALRAAG
ncbi:monooxygenase [Kaistia sp. 32K]|uniref:LLM class flavin-dependent oxidoreductase n=1 Tax=Kaistia sp. 32K TaxID=2795690 RepID=UPI001915BC8D|nr:LLM class flavin-dependent oxidoreductase [Kaistia sp. 32K]BCP55542.1 monooxygenase [Kaistia sp. 32K]